MTPEKKRALEEIMGSLRRMAVRVLEAPASEREEMYEIARQSLKEAAAVAPVGGAFE